MKPVRIILDSTTNVPREQKDRFTVVALPLFFGDEEFLDGVTIDNDTFYSRLIGGNVLPTTSQATPDAFGKVFQQVVAAGEQAVVLTISQNLSGTYQSAVIAAEDYAGDVFVVDSGSVSIGAGILAELALEMVQQGHSAAQIAATLEREREKVRLVAVLDTLQYLKRGGRISAVAALAGSLLSIKPVVEVRNGVIELTAKARGTKQGGATLLRQMEQMGGLDDTKPVLQGYTGLSSNLLDRYLAENREFWERYSNACRKAAIGSVVGTHAGPDAFATAFFVNA